MIKFHIGNCLPFIHGHKPGIVFTPATKVDNKFRLVVVQGFEHGLEPCKGEGAEGKEKGGYDHLLLSPPLNPLRSVLVRDPPTHL